MLRVTDLEKSIEFYTTVLGMNVLERTDNNEHRKAALNTIEAGFDGIELYAANGYLVNQFLDSEANNNFTGQA